MKPHVALLALLAACGTEGSMPEPMDQPDAGMTQPDAPPTPEPEPKPNFTAGSEIGGQLAIDETGIRATFTVDGQQALSYVAVGLSDAATSTQCGVKVFPKFVQFGSASTSTRQFRTVVLDFAQATMLEDTCHWDDAHILAKLAERFGNYTVGFAQARFAEDRPNVDVYLNAANGLGNQTANITRAGGGAAWAMDAAGAVTESQIEPTPGQPLVRALYDF